MKLKIEAARRKYRKRQVLIIADEYANWTDATDVRSAFAESRKYGTHYIVTTQNLDQLRDEQKRIRNDKVVIGNVSHIFAFRMSADDAKQIAEEFSEDAEDNKMKEVANFHYYALTMVNGSPVPSNEIELPEYPTIQARLVPARKAAAWARENTGTPIAEISLKIDNALREPEPKKKKRKIRARAARK